LVIGALSGGVALLVAPPSAALVVAVLVALGLVVPWARAAAVIGGVGFIVAGCLNVVQGQRVHHYLPGSNWAGFFVHAGNLIWIGIVLLVADAVISSVGLRVRKPVRRRALRAVAVGAGTVGFVGTRGAAPGADAPPRRARRRRRWGWWAPPTEL
jgi:hypothetical protein